MQHYRRLLLGMCGVLALVASTSAPVFAVDSSALKDSTALNNKTSYESYLNKGTSTASTAPTQTVDTRASQPSALRYGWNVLSGDPNKIMFKDENGNIIKNQWYTSAGTYGWKYFDAEGYLKRSAWVQDNNAWYYLRTDGDMVFNQIVDGYYLNASGAMDTSNAKASSALKYSGGLAWSDTKGSIGFTASEFESKVASGEIKAKVTYSESTGGTSAGLNSGNVDFYLTK